MDVEGVSSVSGNTSRENLGKHGMKTLSKDTKVDVLDGMVTVTIKLALKYGYSLVTVSNKVQQKVKDTIENMTGLIVTDVNIQIMDVIVLEGA